MNALGGQQVIPSIRSVKEFEKFLKTEYVIGIFMDFHITQLKSMNNLLRQHGKKMILHMDLINGLKADEFGTEYICQEVKPYGIISTKSNVIQKARQKGTMTIQRVFLIDSSSIEKNLKIIQKASPDFIEVLPGVIPKIIKSIHKKSGIDVLTGGLIESWDEVNTALEAGAVAVTTTQIELWGKK